LASCPSLISDLTSSEHSLSCYDPGKSSLPITLNETGRVTYFDTLNPEMTGIIIVNKTITPQKESTVNNVGTNLTNITRELKTLG
jgi:hypothetical protein